jgi:glycosyltransferase involved in cell wall biosynthesis
VIYIPENSRILYICDLNLSHGGAQRITFNTLECLSREFNLYIYSSDEPSPESLDLLDRLNLYSIFDSKFNIQKVIDILNKFNIKYILIQWENSKWIAPSYLIKRKLGIKLILMIYELPYINTPVNSIIKNWFILTLLKYLKSRVRLFNKLIDKKTILYETHNDSYRNSTIKKFLKMGINEIFNIYYTYEGIKYADEIISMGMASTYYLNNYLHINKKIYEVKHTAAVDVKNRIMDKVYKYDFCFMAARLETEKGVIDLLSILYYIKNKFSSNVNIVIIGRFVDDITKNHFYKKLNKLNLEKNVIITGFIPEAEKIDILKTTRIFLYPSRKDMFSISMAEALSYGCPSVVFDLPFTWEFQSNALFRIKYKKINKMVTAALNLLRLSYDNPDKFKKLCECASNDILNQFTWKKTCEDEINAIKNAVK